MITINNLTFRMQGRPLFEGANATIDAGAKVGLVGRNGTGKTTLFKLINGQLQADDGTISIPKGMKIGGVAQEAPGSDRSLLDTVLDADSERLALLNEAQTTSDGERISEIHMRLADIDAHSAEARAGAILHGLGFDAAAQQRPCADFSGGWRMRVALAAVLFAEPDLLLLDEPTNYLDLEGSLWLENYIARYRHTVVIISHDRDLLNSSCNVIVHLEHKNLTVYRGNFDTFEKTRAERLSLQVKQKEKQDARRKHMEAFVTRFRAKASKARQAQSRIKALEKMQEISIAVDETVSALSFPSPQKQAASPIINLHNVSVGYESDKAILSRLNLRIDADDRIALLGANGNGKSTFAKLISDRLDVQSGEMNRADKLKIAMFAQHQLDDLVEEQTPYDHVRRLMPGQAEGKVRSRVARMGLSSEKMDTKAKDLSGGEKARLLLGLITFNAPHLLILDEPTNHLDIDSREQLVMALNDFEGAVILISHDRHLVEASADRLWLVNQGTVGPYDGDMEDYKRLILKGEEASPKAKKSDQSAKKPVNKTLQRQQAANSRARSEDTRKRIKQLETIMNRANEAIAKLDEMLASASMEGDVGKLTELAAKKNEVEKRLMGVEEEWLALSAELEG